MSADVSKKSRAHRQDEAAQLLAEDRLSDREIAAQVEITDRQLWRWKKLPEFAAKVEKIRTDAAAQLAAQGVRLKQNRINRLQARLDKMDALIEARGAKMAETQEIEGGETGLLVRDYKGKDADRAVYSFDAALVREMRDHEKQAAIELGEWTEKSEVNNIGNAVPVINVYQQQPGATGSQT